MTLLHAINIVALTSDVSNDVEQQCLKAGMRSVYLKPLIATEMQELFECNYPPWKNQAK